MASADFCVFSTALRLWLRLSAHSAQTSPGTTRFFPSIYLPHLPHAIPCSYWASTCWAALPSHIAFYAVSVRQARGLPVVSLFPHSASFRFRLTTDTLAFGFLLPATGRIRVFHPLDTCAAGRTQKKTLRSAYFKPLFSVFIIRFSLVDRSLSKHQSKVKPPPLVIIMGVYSTRRTFPSLKKRAAHPV